MDLTDLRVILLGFVLCSLIFALDYSFGLGALSMLYIFFMLLTFWQTKKRYHVVGAVLVSLSLTLIGWLYQTRSINVEISVGSFYSIMDYEGLFRIVTLFVLVFLGGILVRQKSKEFELSKLNESLELRILARTTASEARAKCLEQQIKVLQSISSSQVDLSIKKLDDVINELKHLNEMEVSNVS